MKKTIFEEMGGTYIRHGNYFIPCLTLTEEEQRFIGVWGQRHLRYLKEYRRSVYLNLLTSGRLNSYLADIEEQKKKKEEKQAAAAVKKENAKKEKEVKAAEKKKAKDAKAAKKAAKPKKEKKPKPEPKPGDILKIKPKSIMLFITLVASVIVLISLLNTTVSYTTAISKAKTNLENGDYSKVYESLSGMKLNKSDETLYRQATLITYVTRQYESYQNYMEMDMKTEAINALVKGLARYDTYYNEANSLGVGNQMKEARAQIIQAFNDTFKISESEAVSLVAMSDNNFTQYYRKIEAYGKAR